MNNKTWVKIEQPEGLEEKFGYIDGYVKNSSGWVDALVITNRTITAIPIFHLTVINQPKKRWWKRSR